MGEKPLTVKEVLALQPRAAPYEVRDPGVTPGGYITVWTSGKLSYTLRYRFGGAKKKLTLGQFDAATGGLAEMRAKARAALVELAKARDPRNREALLDPAAAKQAARTTKAAVVDKAQREAAQGRDDFVENVVALFGKRHLAKLRTGAAVLRVLEREVVGRWKGRPLAAVTRADIHDALDEVADRAPIAANRLASYLSKLLKWSLSRGAIAVNPIADGVERPAKEHKRERVLNDEELALVMRAAEGASYPFGDIFRLLVLLAQRKSEISEARWSEIDLEAKTLTLPPARVKTKKAHIVPLPESALTIIESLPRHAGCDLLFTTNGKTPVSGFSRAKTNLDQSIADINGGEPIADFTIHDLRRSCAVGLQRLGVDLIVTEKILNHVSGSTGGVVGVYQRYAYEPEKRAALEKWDAHVRRICGKGESVVTPLRRLTP